MKKYKEIEGWRTAMDIPDIEIKIKLTPLDANENDKGKERIVEVPLIELLNILNLDRNKKAMKWCYDLYYNKVEKGLHKLIE